LLIYNPLNPPSKERGKLRAKKLVFQLMPSPLPVEVIQITSDGGTGLLSHALNDFNAHHSPDCFHVPHDIGKGTSGALASKLKKARKALNKSTQQVEK